MKQCKHSYVYHGGMKTCIHCGKCEYVKPGPLELILILLLALCTFAIFVIGATMIN